MSKGLIEWLKAANPDILCVQEQGDIPYIWALVYPKKELEIRFFELFGTGQIIPNDMGIERKYIGTYQLDNGAFIGHLFERIN